MSTFLGLKAGEEDGSGGEEEGISKVVCFFLGLTSCLFVLSTSTDFFLFKERESLLFYYILFIILCFHSFIHSFIFFLMGVVVVVVIGIGGYV